MPVSGIANIVCSVAMRKAPLTDTPAPPPIVMPSMIAIYGFG